MRILIAAGGTGGHIFPALAVLGALAEQRPEREARWLGGRRGLEAIVVPESGYRLERLWLRSLRSVDLSLATLLDPVRLCASVPQAIGFMARWRPDVIYTTGGYVAIPVLLAARLLGIPSLLWEGNRVPGRSVRATARLASLRTVTFEATRGRLPAPCLTTGTPIRDLATVSRDEARARLGLPADARVLLVFGGSQAVRRLNEAVLGALPDILDDWVVLHLTGVSGHEAALAAAARLEPDVRARYRPVDFLTEDMTAALVAADAVVGRAGSSTLAEATALGLPLVVVPYPHAAAHQAANADEVREAGAAILVRDEELDSRRLLEVAARLADPVERGRAAEASRRLGRPGAARATVELLMALAEHRPVPTAERIAALSRGPA